MRQFSIVLKDGTRKTINRPPRDHSKSLAAKLRRFEASQIGKTNIGNPNHNK